MLMREETTRTAREGPGDKEEGCRLWTSHANNTQSQHCGRGNGGSELFASLALRRLCATISVHQRKGRQDTA